MDDPLEPPALRAFVALAPPDEAKDELARALRPAYDAYPGLRWNRIEDWHITLAFLGELPATAVPLLRTVLAGTAVRQDIASLQQTLTGLRLDYQLYSSQVTDYYDELLDLRDDFTDFLDDFFCCFTPPSE